MVVAEFKCRICRSTNELQFWAHGHAIRWHVPREMRHKMQFHCKLYLCRVCDLLQWDRAFDAVELDWIYGEYRSIEYQQKRSRFEPWYTKTVNWSIGNDAEVREVRTNHLRQVVHAAVAEGKVTNPRRVLDYGGDKGQFVPKFMATEVAVLDVSDQELPGDVKRMKSLNHISEWKPDFVMVCHVLEHLDDPNRTLSEIIARLDKGAVVYIEVPCDRPSKPSAVQVTWIWRSLVKWLTRFRITSVPLDIACLLIKNFSKLGSKFVIQKQSEHINYFSQKTLSHLLRINGLVELGRSEYEIPGRPNAIKAFSVLGQKV